MEFLVGHVQQPPRGVIEQRPVIGLHVAAIVGLGRQFAHLLDGREWFAHGGRGRAKGLRQVVMAQQVAVGVGEVVERVEGVQFKQHHRFQGGHGRQQGAVADAPVVGQPGTVATSHEDGVGVGRATRLAGGERAAERLRAGLGQPRGRVGRLLFRALQGADRQPAIGQRQSGLIVPLRHLAHVLNALAEPLRAVVRQAGLLAQALVGVIGRAQQLRILAPGLQALGHEAADALAHVVGAAVGVEVGQRTHVIDAGVGQFENGSGIAQRAQRVVVVDQLGVAAGGAFGHQAAIGVDVGQDVVAQADDDQAAVGDAPAPGLHVQGRPRAMLPAAADNAHAIVAQERLAQHVAQLLAPPEQPLVRRGRLQHAHQVGGVAAAGPLDGHGRVDLAVAANGAVDGVAHGLRALAFQEVVHRRRQAAVFALEHRRTGQPDVIVGAGQNDLDQVGEFRVMDQQQAGRVAAGLGLAHAQVDGDHVEILLAHQPAAALQGADRRDLEVGVLKLQPRLALLQEVQIVVDHENAFLHLIPPSTAPAGGGFRGNARVTIAPRGSLAS